MDASEIYSKRLNAKEVIFPKEGEFTFPIADGRIKTPGGDQELRTSTLIRPRPIQGEGHVDFLGESEGSFPQPQDSLPDAGEAINDFRSTSGSFIYRHHVEPRVKLYSPREESFPIPLKYIDVTRTTHTNLDVKLEKRIDDYWNIDGSRDLSDPWTGFTQFTLLDEKAPDGYTWSGERLTRKQLTSRPDHLWPELWKSMGKHAKLKEKQKWTEEKIHLDNARKLRGIYFIDPEDKEFKETIKNARKKLETSVAPGTKITRAPCRRRKGEAVPRADNFDDLITADHKVLSDNCESRNNHRYAVVVQDLATQWIQAYPCKNKTSQETQRSLQKFLEPERKPKVIYTDNSLEFGKACEDLSWNHCTSTPHRSETNGIAERAVRRVKEGTSAVLLQSGLNESWWADSMECYTYLRNVTDLLSDGKTPYERRFGKPFGGPIIPFGSLVEYHPITAKDQSRIHQFGKKVLPGLFLGYALYAGGIWKGDVLVADLEELETMDASEIYSKRLNAKEVIFPKENGKFIFQPQMDESNFLEEIRN